MIPPKARFYGNDNPNFDPNAEKLSQYQVD
jgi:hypothetical protein